MLPEHILSPIECVSIQETVWVAQTPGASLSTMTVMSQCHPCRRAVMNVVVDVCGVIMLIMANITHSEPEGLYIMKRGLYNLKHEALYFETEGHIF